MESVSGTGSPSPPTVNQFSEWYAYSVVIIPRFNEVNCDKRLTDAQSNRINAIIGEGSTTLCHCYTITYSV